MTPDTPSGILQRYIAAFVEAVPSARHGDEEAVHRARVASRRLREALPVLAAPEAGSRARREVRRVTRALGPVREIDVALAELAALGERVDGAARAVAHMRRVLLRQRAERRRAMLDALTPGRLAKVTRPLPGGAASPEGGEAAAGTSARRIRRRSARLARAIDKAGGLYLPDRLHAVRIAAKKLRYALELQRAIRPSRATGQTRALKAIQDLLGHMHDLEVLLEHLRATEARGPAADADTSAGLHRLVLALERECRGLHAVYVTKRDALVRLCAAVGAAFGVVPAA